MSQLSFDWRIVAALVMVAVLVAGPSLPWFVFAFALAAGGVALLYIAWQSWQQSGSGGSLGTSKRVVYWRGERVELDSGNSRRSASFNWRDVLPVVLYGIFGVAMLLSALAVTVQNV